jgi:hypothetical protein
VFHHVFLFLFALFLLPFPFVPSWSLVRSLALLSYSVCAQHLSICIDDVQHATLLVGVEPSECGPNGVVGDVLGDV